MWERIGEVCAEIDESKTIIEVVEVLETDPARGAAAFHSKVLSLGSIGLELLEEMVRSAD